MVVMARAPRNDEALTADGSGVATRRWLLVVAAVLAPMVIGALVTVGLYATRAQPVIATPASTAASDSIGRDGSVIVVQPRTTEPVRVPLGSAIEIVLLPGLGEAVNSTNAGILTATANPPCHLTTICGFPGARAFTFQAIGAGVGYLKIIFGFKVCQENGGCTTTPYVFKPIAVYSRPQAS